MTEKQMKRLSRADLLELLLEQMEENKKLEARVQELEQQLADRTLAIRKAGSIAQASLQLNGVFEAAQQAADQYLENIRELRQETSRSCQSLLESAKRRCQELEAAKTAELAQQEEQQP